MLTKLTASRAKKAHITVPSSKYRDLCWNLMFHILDGSVTSVKVTNMRIFCPNCSARCAALFGRLAQFQITGLVTVYVYMFMNVIDIFVSGIVFNL